jgi:hypothetical protein
MTLPKAVPAQGPGPLVGTGFQMGWNQRQCSPQGILRRVPFEGTVPNRGVTTGETEHFERGRPT